MGKRYAIPNPARPGELKPAELVTDRAKRYRANAAVWPGPDICAYCGAPSTMVDHINGIEADGEPENLIRSCRPCNTRKGAVFAHLRLGRRTAQYNPASRGAETLEEWQWAVARILRRDKRTGRLLPPDRWKVEASPAEVARAVAIVRATPHSRRVEFQEALSDKRHSRGGTGGGDEEIPF